MTLLNRFKISRVKKFAMLAGIPGREKNKTKTKYATHMIVNVNLLSQHD